MKKTPKSIKSTENKEKTDFKTVLKLFDEAWKDLTHISKWREIRNKHGWTASEFDQEVTNHMNKNGKSIGGLKIEIQADKAEKAEKAEKYLLTKLFNKDIL